MTMTKLKNKLSLILCIVLIAAIALFTTACGDTDINTPDVETEITSVETASAENVSEIGQGATVFTFGVTYSDGTTDYFNIHTDKTTVGDALSELGLIEGEQGPYGLYIKTVNGITADYNVDGTYWAFYVDGAYATKGIDMTEITEGTMYELKVES